MREIIPASPEHEKEFRATYQLKPEYRDNPECELAFEHAAKFRLYPDELDYVGAIIERQPSAPETPPEKGRE